jgi:DNA-binding NtrC family response regulator
LYRPVLIQLPFVAEQPDTTKVVLGAALTEIIDGKISRVLVVDDDEDILQAARLFLKRHVSQVDTLSNPKLIPDTLAKASYDTILLDMNFTRDVTSGQEGFDWLAKILQIDPDAVVVLITAYGDAETAVRAIKSGATDFVIKPWQNEKLLATILSSIRLRQSRQQVEHLQTRQKQLHDDLDQPFHDFVGTSSPMRDVFKLIEKVAITDANVLILGENGTGKELAARALHRQSSRRDNIFCRVDLGAITESLFESELFGHIKGAFTDAKENRAGRFEVASGGTLFLDEISNLPLSLQPKLLTAIQNRHITRVGSNNPINTDIRLVCASNLSLQELVDKKRFRDDLLYRINTVEIHLPPLRERTDDIPLLMNYFLSLYCKKYRKNVMKISAGAMSRLKKYGWPGNVRELQHAIERAVILCDDTTLSENDFALSTSTGSQDQLVVDGVDLDNVEKTVIQKVLARHGGNVTKAAEALGLTRTSLYRRMQKHGL